MALLWLFSDISNLVDNQPCLYMLVSIWPVLFKNVANQVQVRYKSPIYSSYYKLGNFFIWHSNFQDKVLKNIDDIFNKLSLMKAVSTLLHFQLIYLKICCFHLTSFIWNRKQNNINQELGKNVVCINSNVFIMSNSTDVQQRILLIYFYLHIENVN